jgi:hypothetical protein
VAEAAAVATGTEAEVVTGRGIRWRTERTDMVDMEDVEDEEEDTAATGQEAGTRAGSSAAAAEAAEAADGADVVGSSKKDPFFLISIFSFLFQKFPVLIHL